jgi:hypothetical protein
MADQFDFSGERGRNRTFNLLIKSQLLCQLSYAPALRLDLLRILAASLPTPLILPCSGWFCGFPSLAPGTLPLLGITGRGA